MDMQILSEFRPLYLHKESCSSDDIPLFEDAFDTDSLKTFFRQQSQPSYLTISTNFSPLLAKAKNEDFLLDEASSPSLDERETQASPLTRYINRYSQDASPLAGPAFGVNLNYQFYADTEVTNEIRLPEFPRGIFEGPSYTKDVKASQSALILNEKERFVEMRGQVNTAVLNRNASLTNGNRSAQAISRRESEATEDYDTQSPNIFEKLLRTKKIFKLQRNARPIPKVLKQKACSPKIKTIPAPTQPQSLSVSRKTSNIEVTSPISVAPAYGGSPVKSGPAPVMTFLHAMHEKGYSPQQVMNEIQKFMYHSAVTTEQLSPTKKH